MRASLVCLLIGFLCLLVKAKLGDLCSNASNCPTNAECFEQRCACKTGYQADDNKRVCKLALGQACNKTSECGINTKCKGTPKQCACRATYIAERGRCGRKLGKECASSSDCVRHGYCSGKGICSECYSGFIAVDGFCAKKHECSYYIKRASLGKFYQPMGSSWYHYDVFPCRAKMAHFHCAGLNVDVTVEHGVTLKTNFYAKESTGGVYVRDVIVTLTTNNSDGNVTSQILRLNTDDYRKYVKKEDFEQSPWNWSYTGKKPRRKHRIKGNYSRYRARVSKGPLDISYSDQYSDLDIVCYDNDFSNLADAYQTICGFPGDSEYSVKKELEAKSRPGQSVLSVIDPYIALAKQSADTTDPQCLEAKTVLTGPCSDLGGAMKKCGDYYTTKWVSGKGRCMRKNSIDSFKVYIACLQLMCGCEGEAMRDCDELKKAKDTCGIWDLYSLANCTSTANTAV